MRKAFFENSKKGGESSVFLDEPFLKELGEVNTFFLSQLKPSPFSEQLKRFSASFLAMSPEEQIFNLPEFYLKFEDYLTGIDPDTVVTKDQLRKIVKERFPKLLEKDNIGFLFQEEVAEEIYLGKFFIKFLLRDIIQSLAEAQGQFFLFAKKWVNALPRMEPDILDLDSFTFVNDDPNDALFQLSEEVSNRLENEVGEQFTQMIYDRNFDVMAKHYRSLPGFPFVISLIPVKYLNADKIGRLSVHQLSATLLHQAKFLENLKSQLADRNVALIQAKEELRFTKKENEVAFKQLEKQTAELEASQKEQEQILRELKESNEELEQFASVASHDLQEPLRTIEGYINLITKEIDLEKNEKLTEFIDHTVLGVTRMQELIKDLLAYSRVGVDARQIVEIDMDVLLEVVRYNLRRVILETSAVISIDCPVNLIADRTQMMQLFQNLISNAIKFCEAEVVPRIQITCKGRAEDWLCSVKDNGIGIKPEQQAQVFALFKRFSPYAKHHGTGIGLAICKKIVEQHQGQIWVESINGRGSTFFFTIKKPGILPNDPMTQ